MADATLQGAIELKNQLLETHKKLLERAEQIKHEIEAVDHFIAVYRNRLATNSVDNSLGRIQSSEIQGESPPKFGASGEVESRPKNPPKEEVARAVREEIEKSNRPMPRAELFNLLVERGILLEGKDPAMVLSTMLWRAGDEFNIVNIRGLGYWKKEEPWEDRYHPDTGDAASPHTGPDEKETFFHIEDAEPPKNSSDDVFE